MRSANLGLASYQKIGKKSGNMRGIVFIKKMILKEKLYNIRLKHIYTDYGRIAAAELRQTLFRRGIGQSGRVFEHGLYIR